MRISEDTVLRKSIREPVIVISGCTFVTHGITDCDITVERHAKCVIYGTHHGNIVNHGTVDVYGTVVDCKLVGVPMTVHSGAIVNGKCYE